MVLWVLEEKQTLTEEKKGQKFVREWAEWSVYRNFVQNYDEVYGTIERANVMKIGRKAPHLLSRPEYVFFANECGCNTSQEGDGA
jgi:hypothetical protein